MREFEHGYLTLRANQSKDHRTLHSPVIAVGHRHAAITEDDSTVVVLRLTGMIAVHRLTGDRAVKGLQLVSGYRQLPIVDAEGCRLREVSSGEIVWTHRGAVTRATASPSDRLVAFHEKSSPTVLRVIDTILNTERAALDLPGLRRILLTKQRLFAVTFDHGSHVITWDTSNWRQMASVNFNYGVTSLDVSPDGTRLAVAGTGKIDGGIDGPALSICRLSNFSSLRTLLQPEDRNDRQTQLGAVAFSPDGSAVVAGSREGDLIYREFETGRHLHTKA